MKTKNTFFQDYISNKVSQMIAESTIVKDVTHSGLKGSFREYSLSNLLKDLLPTGVGVGSGQIQDSYGNQSPETDLLIWDKTLLPPILRSEDLGIYPLESCCYFFEIKSVINATNIKDAIEKSERIDKLLFLQTYRNPKVKLLKIFFAYCSDSEDINEIQRFMKYSKRPNNPHYDAICIVNKGYWAYSPASQKNKNSNWLFFHPDKDHYEVISLIAGILNTLAGEYRPSFGYYILDPEENGKASILEINEVIPDTLNGA